METKHQAFLGRFEAVARAALLLRNIFFHARGLDHSAEVRTTVVHMFISTEECRGNFSSRQS